MRYLRSTKQNRKYKKAESVKLPFTGKSCVNSKRPPVFERWKLVAGALVPEDVAWKPVTNDITATSILRQRGENEAKHG